MELKRLANFAALLLSCSMPAMADIKGSADHPLLGRFGDATISAYQASNYDAVTLPSAAIESEDEASQLLELEGRITRIGYRLPVENTALEIARNYEAALSDSEFDILLSCAGRSECGAGFRNYVIRSGNVFAKAFDRAAINDNFRAILATRDDHESRVHIFLFMMEDRANNRTLVRQIVVEGEPLQLGQVSIKDASALQAALDTDGSVIVDGIFFATDSATIEAESAEALEQMAELLRSAPELAVYIVGHTDNQGSLDYNLELSQRRANAVVEALGALDGIDAARLDARGVASLAPIASNAGEAGRAQNRRVELVLQ
ncbi:OmpA family protein [Halomonas heilongjiangensis]|uniref:Cell envelope biogenesis protein OmpA n=1 Tax=Halomonas heilongjiangensis TaxID=1387883 RepID=A0A2N7TL69_9GAMM|nr:OmpA family protein [Halomonas heilongjiangensis]PMR68878.1 cell envelope biogenesis protein OmpA [Halomonas heilongjiangensis]PXX94521.1 cell envelope biogenesis protein OmpA [Halomonas heilongjiangensis]